MRKHVSRRSTGRWVQALPAGVRHRAPGSTLMFGSQYGRPVLRDRAALGRYCPGIPGRSFSLGATFLTKLKKTCGLL